MYSTKQLLPVRGRLKINVLFYAKDETQRTFKDAITSIEREGVETGYSQSVNVKNNLKQMVEEAVLNAFYKWNHRVGGKVFQRDNYVEDLGEYISSFKILSYKVSYFEDRIYSYKRERVVERKTGRGRYKYTIRRKGRVYRRYSTNRLNKKELNKLSSDMV